MKIDNYLIVRSNKLGNFTHSYLSAHRIGMLHFTPKNKTEKTLCGIVTDGWSQVYNFGLELITKQKHNELKVTEKDFCKRCLKKFNG